MSGFILLRLHPQVYIVRVYIIKGGGGYDNLVSSPKLVREGVYYSPCIPQYDILIKNLPQ